MLRVARDEDEATKVRVEAYTWLADRGGNGRAKTMTAHPPKSVVSSGDPGKGPGQRSENAGPDRGDSTQTPRVAGESSRVRRRVALLAGLERRPHPRGRLEISLRLQPGRLDRHARPRPSPPFTRAILLLQTVAHAQILGRHPGRHRMSIPGIPGTHDPWRNASLRMVAQVGMGGTGLEPVTPSLSIRSSVRAGSRGCAQGALLSESPCATERLRAIMPTSSLGGICLAAPGGAASAVTARMRLDAVGIKFSLRQDSL
jgi:hypothetical protein